MKKTHITLTFSLIAAASLALASDTEKRSQLEQEIGQLNDDIRLIDIELGKNITHERYPCGSTYTSFDISSKEAMNLLAERGKKHSTLESKQQELESLSENQ